MKSLQNNFFAPNIKEILPEVFKIYVGQKFSMILRTHGKRNGIPCELTKTELTIYNVHAWLDKELFELIRQLTFSPVL